MFLRQDIDIADFFDKVRSCQGEVTFRSDEGDILNLKSQLSQYVFVAVFHKNEFQIQGRIVCDRPEDYRILQDYLE